MMTDTRVNERQHARYFLEDLEHHLRETLELFGETLYAQAEACREELAYALVDTGRHLTSSVGHLRERLRRTGERIELGAVSATEQIGRTFVEAGDMLEPGSGVRPLPRGVTGTEASQHHVPEAHVEITMQGYELLRPEPEPEERVPYEGQHQRDSKVA